jgi:hypothetical protein
MPALDWTIVATVRAAWNRDFLFFGAPSRAR